MHALAALIVPTLPARDRAQPSVVREIELHARIETLLYRYEAQEQREWGFNPFTGSQFDWWVIGGRWSGWGRRVREKIRRRGSSSRVRSLPKSVERNAVWSEDVSRAGLSALAEYPHAVVTPHGRWIDCPRVLPAYGKPTLRQRQAKTAWLKKIRQIAAAYPSCLFIAIDYHF